MRRHILSYSWIDRRLDRRPIGSFIDADWPGERETKWAHESRSSSSDHPQVHRPHRAHNQQREIKKSLADSRRKCAGRVESPSRNRAPFVSTTVPAAPSDRRVHRFVFLGGVLLGTRYSGTSLYLERR
ncbi:hypothetical protein NLU13_4043 [Sarocladium strictum]|uniref:Uncharacterized protein n=1 Tax=Sarocladium strictum TaxID=5046 RepID=A0AA39L898_SARSR|nr:hypothetical protein NLU13_4043 [Sarocladium strictum]